MAWAPWRWRGRGLSSSLSCPHLEIHSVRLAFSASPEWSKERPSSVPCLPHCVPGPLLVVERQACREVGGGRGGVPAVPTAGEHVGRRQSCPWASLEQAWQGRGRGDHRERGWPLLHPRKRGEWPRARGHTAGTGLVRRWGHGEGPRGPLERCWWEGVARQGTRLGSAGTDQAVVLSEGPGTGRPACLVTGPGEAGTG